MPAAEISDFERKVGIQVSAPVGNNFIKINFACPACGQLKED